MISAYAYALHRVRPDNYEKGREPRTHANNLSTTLRSTNGQVTECCQHAWLSIHDFISSIRDLLTLYDSDIDPLSSARA